MSNLIGLDVKIMTFDMPGPMEGTIVGTIEEPGEVHFYQLELDDKSVMLFPIESIDWILIKKEEQTKLTRLK